MSRSEPSRRSRAGAAAALAALLLLTGCGAGQLTATSTQRGSAGGANADAGDILVREAEIEFGDSAPGEVVYPAGTTAPLQMRIVNQGVVADRLVSATSRAASVVHLSGPLEVPAGQVLVVGSRPPAAPGVRTAQITLTGLHEDVRAGLTYELVLVFERAGPVLLHLPVDNPTTPREATSE